MSKSGNDYTRPYILTPHLVGCILQHELSTIITIIIHPYCLTTDCRYPLRIENAGNAIPITTLYSVKFTCRISGVHAPLHEHEDAQVPEQKQQEDHLWNVLQKDHLWLPEEAGNTAAFKHRARHNSTHQNY